MIDWFWVLVDNYLLAALVGVLLLACLFFAILWRAAEGAARAWRALARDAQRKLERRCGEAGCTAEGMDCYSLDDFLKYPRQVSERLCPAHAAQAGYCAACGVFSAGQDGFDHLHEGLCDVCADQARADNGDFGDVTEENWDDADFIEE